MPKGGEKKLMRRVRDEIRTRHYARSTETTYVHWILRYICFHDKRHPALMGVAEIEAFLSHLAQERTLSASSQNQALNAIIFLYRQVLGIDVGDGINAVRARRRERIPVVLTTAEVRRILAVMRDPARLMTRVLYGGGLRVRECTNLRVKDVDLEMNRIMLLDSKGKRDRFTVLPAAVREDLRDQIKRVKALHEQDLARGFGKVILPHAFHRKSRAASGELRWQWLFPAATLFTNPKTGERGRWHVHASYLQRAVREAANKVGIHKRVTPHCFRHSFATHLLEAGYNIRAVQELMGHKSVETTMIYTHVMSKGESDVKSPLDIF